MYDPAHRQLALDIVARDHPHALGALWAGSLSRGRGTATSDIDLVVFYPYLDRAWRETLVERHIVECFVHDLVSLDLFLGKDREAGVPVLATMVHEGVVLVDGAEVEAAKRAARDSLDAGPLLWSTAEKERHHYTITNIRDDLASETNPDRLRALGCFLYDTLLGFHRRTKGQWTAKLKAIPELLRKEEPELAGPYLDAFDRLFETADAAPLVSLIDEILAPHGGPFYRWYSLAPPHRDPT